MLGDIPQRYYFYKNYYRITGGEGGIRTLDTLQTYTPLAGARFQPLSHFSKTYRVEDNIIIPQKLTIAIKLFCHPSRVQRQSGELSQQVRYIFYQLLQ